MHDQRPAYEIMKGMRRDGIVPTNREVARALRQQGKGASTRSVSDAVRAFKEGREPIGGRPVPASTDRDADDGVGAFWEAALDQAGLLVRKVAEAKREARATTDRLAAAERRLQEAERAYRALQARLKGSEERVRVVEEDNRQLQVWLEKAESVFGHHAGAFWDRVMQVVSAAVRDHGPLTPEQMMRSIPMDLIDEATTHGESLTVETLKQKLELPYVSAHHVEPDPASHGRKWGPALEQRCGTTGFDRCDRLS